MKLMTPLQPLVRHEHKSIVVLEHVVHHELFISGFRLLEFIVIIVGTSWSHIRSLPSEDHTDERLICSGCYNDFYQQRSHVLEVLPVEPLS